MIALCDAGDVTRYGGKASGLAAALRAGLPVPDGFAIAWDEHASLTTEALAALVAPLGRVAVRSSAVDEDGAGASFAGQHKTIVNPRDVLAAVREVEASCHEPSALAYRAKLGLVSEPRMAVVVQQLVDATSAGVMFTRHPLTGADERVVEAAWGLGEAVVAGLVTPDTYRWARGASTYGVMVGFKDLAIRPAAEGVAEVCVPEAQQRAQILAEEQLERLDALSLRCERYAGPGIDLEWAFVGAELYLLQCRKVTR